MYYAQKTHSLQFWWVITQQWPLLHPLRFSRFCTKKTLVCLLTTLADGYGTLENGELKIPSQCIVIPMNTMGQLLQIGNLLLFSSGQFDTEGLFDTGQFGPKDNLFITLVHINMFFYLYLQFCVIPRAAAAASSPGQFVIIWSRTTPSLLHLT